MPIDTFEGKTAFVTGGASGIGLGIAKVLVARSALPALAAGEYYLVDLIGAKVVGPDGPLGEVIDIEVHPTVDCIVVDFGAEPADGFAMLEHLATSGGLDEVRGMVRARPWTILGAGLLIAGVTATVPLLFGEPFLENGKLELDLPLIGSVGVTSGLAFDVGVYLVVVGLVFMVFEAFGGYDRTRTSA